MVDINQVLSEITNDYEKNKQIFIKYYNHLDTIDGQNNSLYHLIMKSSAPVETKKVAIATLFHFKVNYNTPNFHGDTFIHTAIEYNNDMNFILDTLHYLCTKGFDINKTNKQKYTFLHIAIMKTEKYEDIVKLINYISRCNFNFNAVDNYGYTLINYVNFEKRNKRLTLVQKGKLIKLIKEGIDNMSYEENFDNTDESIDDDEKRKLMEDLLRAKGKKFDPLKYGIILNDKDYPIEPAIGREEEVRKLIVSIASRKKTPILVGESGVGKTAIVDELAYLIQNDMVPEFLIDKVIYEINLTDIVNGTKYRGDLEEVMKKIMNYVLSNNIILFIDEIHTIRGAGASTDDKNDIAKMLRFYIDRCGLKAIGATTTKEYEEHLSNEALKRRFDIIKVKELASDKLHDAIINAIDYNLEDYQLKISTIFLQKLDEIIDILIELTKDNHRVYNDKLSNPDLVLSIIDRSFAYPRVDNEHEYNIKHLVLGINDCERINPSAREDAIKKIYYLTRTENQEKVLKKARIIDFKEYLKDVKY